MRGLALLAMTVVSACAPSAEEAPPEILNSPLSCPETLASGPDQLQMPQNPEPPSQPHDAWLCVYLPPTDTEEMTSPVPWPLEQVHAPLRGESLNQAQATITGLTPKSRTERACTRDLGPIWAVVFADGSDIYALTVEGYGCHDTRLIGPIDVDDANVGANDEPITGLWEPDPQLIATLEQEVRSRAS